MNIPHTLLKLALGKRLTTTSGEIQVAGLSQPITIRRDAYGIPYIQAENNPDAWFGLGFCQGQDRAFQIEMLRRLTRGTLAELVGPDGLVIDRLSRRIGFDRAAKGHARLLSGETRDMMGAFSKGVNQGIEHGGRKSPHEFVLMGITPDEFRVTDALAGLNYIAFGLSTWTAKLTRLVLLRLIGEDALREMDTPHPSWLPATSPVGQPSGPALDRLADDLARLMGMIGPGGASNQWAVNASRSATGRPILANDPHLAPTQPPPWYLVHLRTPEFSVCGASFVGAPIIPSGHNDTAAWGVTAGLADNLDIYLEDLSEDGLSAREGDSYHPCERVAERYLVRGKPAFEEYILITRRGPVISDLLEGELGVISMRATWMRPTGVNGLARLYRAQNFAEMRQAFEEMPLSSLNMAYADTDDNIGWQLVGDVPQRGQAWGVLPLPGWDPTCDWKVDPLPFEQMPHLFNPETGYLANANNRPQSGNDGPYLGDDWAEGYRLSRILELLAQRDDWDLEAMGEMQMDQLSLPWREMRSAVLAAPADNPETRQALEILSAWNGIVSSDSPAAALYQSFVSEIFTAMVESKAPEAVEWVMGKGFHPMFPKSSFAIQGISNLVHLLRTQPEGWFKDTWEAEISAAMGRAISKLRRQFGSNPYRWTWGKVRPLTLLHPAGSRWPMDRIFNLGPFPWGGDHQTLAQTGRLVSDLRANPRVIANLRMVVDVGNWEDNRFVLAGGQSGNPFSPHYSDLLELWKQGEGVPIAWSEKSIRDATKDTLVLNPVSAT